MSHPVEYNSAARSPGPNNINNNYLIYSKKEENTNRHHNNITVSSNVDPKSLNSFLEIKSENKPEGKTIDLKLKSPQRNNKSNIEIIIESPNRNIKEPKISTNKATELNIDQAKSTIKKNQIDLNINLNDFDSDAKHSSIYKKILQKHTKNQNFDRPNRSTSDGPNSGKKEITLKINQTPNKEHKFNSSTQNIEVQICENKPSRTPSPTREIEKPEYNKELIHRIVNDAIDNSQEYIGKYLKNKDFSANKHLTTLIDRLKSRRNHMDDTKEDRDELMNVRDEGLNLNNESRLSIDESKKLDDIRASRLAYIKATKLVEMKASRMKESNF